MTRTASTDPALTPGEPRGTIHFVIGRALSRSMGGDTPVRENSGDSLLAWSATRDDPESRASYAIQVSAAWGVLGFAFIVAMVVVAVPVKLLFGDAAGNVAISACLAGCLFCVAGGANVLWRRYYYVPQAQRRARRGGVGSEAYASSMRRTLPRNSSLVLQTAVGILAFLGSMSSP